MASENAESMTIVRKGKMTRSGVKKLAKKHRNKYETMDVAVTGYRYVESAEKPKY